MTAAGLHRHGGIRPSVCAKCGLAIAYDEEYVHDAKKNYHVTCYVDSRGSPIYRSSSSREQPDRRSS